MTLFGEIGSAGTAILALIALIGFVMAYLLPTIVAFVRKMPNQGTIVVINVFLGWLVIGWIVASAMACGSNAAQTVVVHNVIPGHGPPASLPQPTWDAQRNAWLYLDPATHSWFQQRPDGSWGPLDLHAGNSGPPRPLPPPQI